MTIEEMLDQLAEFQAQVDLLGIQKKELIDAVKVPEEIQAIHDEGVKRKRALDDEYQKTLARLETEKDELLASVVIPPEIQAVYEAVAQKRKAIETEIEQKKNKLWFDTVTLQNKAEDEFTSQAREVYANVERRKCEIDAEFSEKAIAANDNIAKLTAEIKAATVKAGKSIKGKFYQAIYVRGRVSWNTDMLDGLIIQIPELNKARKEGAPSVTLRRI